MSHTPHNHWHLKNIIFVGIPTKIIGILLCYYAIPSHSFVLSEYTSPSLSILRRNNDAEAFRSTRTSFGSSSCTTINCTSRYKLLRVVSPQQLQVVVIRGGLQVRTRICLARSDGTRTIGNSRCRSRRNEGVYKNHRKGKVFFHFHPTTKSSSSLDFVGLIRLQAKNNENNSEDYNNSKKSRRDRTDSDINDYDNSDDRNENTRSIDKNDPNINKKESSTPTDDTSRNDSSSVTKYRNNIYGLGTNDDTIKVLDWSIILFAIAYVIWSRL